jgi:16S rRNA (guanine1207-N2)-methyltransferase
MDSGTEALLEALRSYPLAGQQVLDFACGAGLVGAFLSALQPQVRVELLDVDALALAAASENVPGARLIHSDGFRALEDERYNLIVSNPPYHEGKAETGKIVESLVRGAPDHLVAGGSLVLVTQRRLPLADLMGATFNQVEVLLDAGPHRVWLGGM